jgi:hypothetical protein
MRRKNETGQNVKKTSKPFRCFYFGYFIFIASFLIMTPNLFSQENDGWIFKSSSNGIDVFFQTDEFHDDANGLHYEYVLLKFQNTTKANKKITVIPDLYYNGIKIESETVDIAGSIFFLNAGESRSGSVDSKSPDYLKIFSRFLNYSDKPVLTGFELNINSEDL